MPAFIGMPTDVRCCAERDGSVGHVVEFQKALSNVTYVARHTYCELTVNGSPSSPRSRTSPTLPSAGSECTIG